MAERRNKVTMADIARESGLSLSTVSLVLNEKPGLPQETRQKVLSVAREMGYEMRVSPPAVNRHSSLHTLGMLVKRSSGDQAPPSSNIFFSHVMAGIEAGCRQENISLLYSTLPVDEYNRCIEIPRLIQDSRINGIILVGSYIDEPLNAALRERGVPVVLVDAYCCEGEYDSVLIENFEGAYQAIQYLINKGHRQIAFVGSTPDTRLSFRYRRQGYCQALKDNGINEYYFGDCQHNDREAIIATTRQLLIENPQVTAVFGCNDEVAIIALHGALDAGRRVPQDLSVIGFDNNTNAVNSLPPLTTMHVDKIGMGRLAVQLMINRAENADLGIVTLYVHTKLIERQSVKDLC
jgi:LacI family transcriptional regulator